MSLMNHEIDELAQGPAIVECRACPACAASVKGLPFAHLLQLRSEKELVQRLQWACGQAGAVAPSRVAPTSEAVPARDDLRAGALLFVSGSHPARSLPMLPRYCAPLPTSSGGPYQHPPPALPCSTLALPTPPV
jgi:hypothetical protein